MTASGRAAWSKRPPMGSARRWLPLGVRRALPGGSEWLGTPRARGPVRCLGCSSEPPRTPPTALAFDRSGSVGDYRNTSSLQRRVAAVAGVSPSLVSIRVAAGSVIITATIGLPPSATASVVRASLAARLRTAAAASAELGVEVVSAPRVAVAPPLASPPPPQPLLPAACCEPPCTDGLSGVVACAAIYSPVCGADGKTYSNRCRAE